MQMDARAISIPTAYVLNNSGLPSPPYCRMTKNAFVGELITMLIVRNQQPTEGGSFSQGNPLRGTTE